MGLHVEALGKVESFASLFTREEASRDVTGREGPPLLHPHSLPFLPQPPRFRVHDPAADELGGRCSGAGLGGWP